MQVALLRAIQTLAQVMYSPRKESDYSAYQICEVLLATYPEAELEVLTVLLDK